MTKEQERLSPEAIANKRRYNLEYRKRNYKNFTVGLTIEEAEEYAGVQTTKFGTLISDLQSGMK